jgi:lysophospholipase L1-like esterase
MIPISRSSAAVSAGLLAVSLPAIAASPASYKLTCSTATAHGFEPLNGTRYKAETPLSFGFDLAPSPSIANKSCVGDMPFFISVAIPEGNYRVTVVLGNTAAASNTTVKAEARRLMLWNIAAKPGQSMKQSFIVNVRTPRIASDQTVKLKPREVGNLDWDDKLTIEFTGNHPSLQTIEIEPASVPTIYLAGDSTVVDQDKEPWAAWGQILPAFFNDKIAVANDAESGETLRSFVGERRFDKIFTTLHQGDYLFMQFAHNDQKPGAGLVPIPQYKELLTKYISMARDKGAHPVLVTSMNRRSFAADGTITQTLAGYPDAMREVAKEQNVPLIDLNAMSKTLFEAMGPDGTLKAFVHYPANTFPEQADELKDDTHFNSYGAMELAKCVIEAIRQLGLPIAKDIRPEVPRFDPAHPDPASLWNLPLDPFLSAQKPYER